MGHADIADGHAVALAVAQLEARTVHRFGRAARVRGDMARIGERQRAARSHQVIGADGAVLQDHAGPEAAAALHPARKPGGPVQRAALRIGAIAPAQHIVNGDRQPWRQIGTGHGDGAGDVPAAAAGGHRVVAGLGDVKRRFGQGRKRQVHAGFGVVGVTEQRQGGAVLRARSFACAGGDVTLVGEGQAAAGTGHVIGRKQAIADQARRCRIGSAIEARQTDRLRKCRGGNAPTPVCPQRVIKGEAHPRRQVRAGHGDGAGNVPSIARRYRVVAGLGNVQQRFGGRWRSPFTGYAIGNFARACRRIGGPGDAIFPCYRLFGHARHVGKQFEMQHFLSGRIKIRSGNGARSLCLTVARRRRTGPARRGIDADDLRARCTGNAAGILKKGETAVERCGGHRHRHVAFPAQPPQRAIVALFGWIGAGLGNIGLFRFGIARYFRFPLGGIAIAADFALAVIGRIDTRDTIFPCDGTISRGKQVERQGFDPRSVKIGPIDGATGLRGRQARAGPGGAGRKARDLTTGAGYGAGIFGELEGAGKGRRDRGHGHFAAPGHAGLTIPDVGLRRFAGLFQEDLFGFRQVRRVRIVGLARPPRIPGTARVGRIAVPVGSVRLGRGAGGADRAGWNIRIANGAGGGVRATRQATDRGGHAAHAFQRHIRRRIGDGNLVQIHGVLQVGGKGVFFALHQHLGKGDLVPLVLGPGRINDVLRGVLITGEPLQQGAGLGIGIGVAVAERRQGWYSARDRFDPYAAGGGLL